MKITEILFPQQIPGNWSIGETLKLYLIAFWSVIAVLFVKIEIMVFFLLCFTSIVMLDFLDWGRNPLRFLRAAIFFPAVEILMILFGIHSYHNTMFIVPIWLPLAWGQAAIFIKHKRDVKIE